MYINYNYNNYSYTSVERDVEVTSIESLVRAIRADLKGQTYQGGTSHARIYFEDCAEAFEMSLEGDTFHYSLDGWDMPYKEFKATLTKYIKP